MTALSFSRDDIQKLAKRLDSLRPALTDHERTLLLAIFTAASAHVSLSAGIQGSPEPTVRDLKRQIENSFIPGNDNNFNIIIPARIGVWPGPIPSPHPTPHPAPAPIPTPIPTPPS